MRISDWSSDVCSSDLPCAAVIRHEQRIADEGYITDPVGQVGGGVAGRVHCLDLQRPKRETLSIDEESVEVGAVGLQVIECEDWAEDLLHVTDMLANADQRAGLCLDIRSEEHTSELQSLMRISYAVFCLKKKIKQTHRKKN